MIKKSRANHYNGSQFDVVHYETQAEMVRIYDSLGGDYSNLDELMLKGKSLAEVDLDTVTETGLYSIVGCTNTPATISAEKPYVMKIDGVEVDGGKIVRQEVFDYENKETFQRYIVSDTISEWLASSNNLNEALETINSLINGVDAKVAVNISDIAKLVANLSTLEQKVNTHNHDGTYLKTAGGSIVGQTEMSNNASYAGKVTSGEARNLIKMNNSNRVEVGNVSSGLILKSNSSSISVTDGTSTYTLYHTGNQGANSGMDAETLGGYTSSSFAKLNASNTFESSQLIANGSHLTLQATSGSSQAGTLYFRDGSGAQKGAIKMDVNGNMTLYTNNTFNHVFSASGDIVTNGGGKHLFHSNGKDVGVVLKESSSDNGVGFIMGSNYNAMLWDYRKGRSVFIVDRENSVVNFTNNISIQGKRLHIGAIQPTSPSTGDIWIS